MASRAAAIRVTDIDSLESVYQQFQRAKQAQNLSPRTIEYYQQRLTPFLAWCDSQSIACVTDVTTDDLRQFISQETQRSEALGSHAHSALGVFFSWAESEGILSTNPIARIPKPRRKQELITPLSDEHIKALIESCDCKTFPGLRDKAMMLTLVDTGLRSSELCDMAIADIDFTGRSILVTCGKGRKQRRVYFGVSTAQVLAQYLSRRGKLNHERVFVTACGRPLDRHLLHKIMHDRFEAAGVTGVKSLVHVFRHSAATAFIANGGGLLQAQALLGHSSFDMVRRYAKLADSDVQAAHRQYGAVDRMDIGATTGKKRLR